MNINKLIKDQCESIDYDEAEALPAYAEVVCKEDVEKKIQQTAEAVLSAVTDWAIENQKGMWNGNKDNPRLEQVVNVHELLTQLTNKDV